MIWFTKMPKLLPVIMGITCRFRLILNQHYFHSFEQLGKGGLASVVAPNGASHHSMRHRSFQPVKFAVVCPYNKLSSQERNQQARAQRN